MADIPEVPEVPEVSEEVSPPEQLVLLSKDGEEFKVSFDVAMEAETIKRLHTASPDQSIKLEEVIGSHLKKTIEYLEWYHDVKEKEKNDVYVPLALKEHFKDEFVEVDVYELAELLKAAHYLGIESMKDITAKKIAEHIEKMSVEEIRELFGEPDDLSPEEKAEFEEEFKKLMAENN
ncbi:hypothetical protein P9112_000618 [Eukaryota sp. TZLM1-RC]